MICDRINVTTNFQEIIDKRMEFTSIIGNPPYTDTTSVDSDRNNGAGGCSKIWIRSSLNKHSKCHRTLV